VGHAERLVEAPARDLVALQGEIEEPINLPAGTALRISVQNRISDHSTPAAVRGR